MILMAIIPHYAMSFINFLWPNPVIIVMDQYIRKFSCKEQPDNCLQWHYLQPQFSVGGMLSHILCNMKIGIIDVATALIPKPKHYWIHPVHPTNVYTKGKMKLQIPKWLACTSLLPISIELEMETIPITISCIKAQSIFHSHKSKISPSSSCHLTQANVNRGCFANSSSF